MKFGFNAKYEFKKISFHIKIFKSFEYTKTRKIFVTTHPAILQNIFGNYTGISITVSRHSRVG
ncbi:MAG: hypothetical protein COX07_07930 [Bacteroidetes bacterium CG23_combo_of_CG06-09_8_20_14_all_32_9]|nr:MAG: hypothetical protein COX07_07930 [Bacteroidetes bacterium CG23_combo_of_CG06-09_8_20_14_all_32_9]